MRNFAAFIEILKEFESGESGHKKKEEELQRIKNEHRIDTPEGRKEYSDIIAECFIPCAKKILAGHFRVVSTVGGNECVREIYPTVLELYYYEEGPGGFKDPIMYHTTDRKYYEFYKDKYEELKDKKGRQSYFDKRGIDALPYYPIGALNPHPSGLDITFENSDKHYRASCLIREYDILFLEGEEGKKKEIIRIENSTDIYDDMLFNGISPDNADWIEWGDGNEEVKDIYPSTRKNVSAYEKYNETPELWRKIVVKDSNNNPVYKNNKLVFENCPFDWQFSKHPKK